MTESPPTLERMNATGSSTTSCLRTEIQRLNMPWARAWKTEEQTMQKPARRKLKLMVLQSRDADGQHVVGGVENRQQPVR